MSVLGVAQLNAVVIDGGMLAAHGAHIDGLDTSHSAVVLELDAGEIAQRVRHRKRIETLQFLAFEGLRHNDVLGQGTRRHLHLLYLEAVIYRIGLCLVQCENRACTKCGKQYETIPFNHCAS